LSLEPGGAGQLQALGPVVVALHQGYNVARIPEVEISDAVILGCYL
jgi:hypothetical protein